MADYITIDNSNGTLNRQYWATRLQVDNSRNQSIEPTLASSIDISYGLALKQYNFTIAAAESSGGTVWGTYANLETLYGYSDPGGTPSTLLTLIDHDGGTHTGYLVGNIPREPLSIILSGTTSYWALPVQFLVKPA